MTNLFYSEFKRKFSLSMYKNLKIKLGEMSFFKNFVNDTRGALYPVVQKSYGCVERVENNCYVIKGGTVKRLFCQFFPFASYEITCSDVKGDVGFCFRLPDSEARIFSNGDTVRYSCAEHLEACNAPKFVGSSFTMIVTCRLGAFDVYFKNNGKPEFLCTFYEESFKSSN